MKSLIDGEDEYESLKHSLCKSQNLLRYLYYTLVVFLVALIVLFVVLMAQSTRQLVDTGFVIILGMMLAGLICTTYILCKDLVKVVKLNTDRTQRSIQQLFLHIISLIARFRTLLSPNRQHDL